MDLTNRILIIGGALLWIFVMVVIILLAWGAPDESIERIADLAGYLDDHNSTASKLIITLGGIVLSLLALIVVLVEVAPPEGGSLKVANVGGGDARIPTDEVAHLVQQELLQMPQLTHVDAKVQARGDKAEVNLDLHVGADADLAATTEEACRRASELIANRIGVGLAKPPQAQIHYRELRVARKEAPASGASTSSGASGPQHVSSHSQPTEEPAAPPTFKPPSTATEPSHEAPETPQQDRPAGV